MATRRQLLIALGAGVLGWTGAVRAQAPARVRRIGWLASSAPSAAAPMREAFRHGLRDLGWVEGKNYRIEYPDYAGSSDRLPDLAAELVRLKVDVILAPGVSSALAAHKATKSIPIVVVTMGDPVALGFAESLARPGGNVTGLSQMTSELASKRLELLKEMVPKLSRVAVLRNPKQPATTLTWKELQLPARQLGLELYSLEVESADGLDKAFEDAIRARAGAIFITASPVTTGRNLKRIAELAAKSRLPSIVQYPEFADIGGLMAYGPNRADNFRRAATYVDKILKGVKPGDLPVEQPTKFELVINMKTAKALGLTIPPSVLVRADRVIE